MLVEQKNRYVNFTNNWVHTFFSQLSKKEGCLLNFGAHLGCLPLEQALPTQFLGRPCNIINRTVLLHLLLGESQGSCFNFYTSLNLSISEVLNCVDALKSQRTQRGGVLYVYRDPSVIGYFNHMTTYDKKLRLSYNANFGETVGYFIMGRDLWFWSIVC